MPRDNPVSITDMNTVWANNMTNAITHHDFIERFRHLPEYATVTVLALREMKPDNTEGDIEYLACSANMAIILKRVEHDCKYSMYEDKSYTFRTTVTGNYNMNTDYLLLDKKEYRIVSVTSYEKCDWITILGLQI